MDKILDNLFYNEKLGVENKTTFIKKVQEKHTEFKTKDIQAYLKNQEVNQVNTTVNKSYEYKITAPPRTFQIDIFWWRRGESLLPILLLVDILSRKAWAYVLLWCLLDLLLGSLGKLVYPLFYIQGVSLEPF